MAMKLNDLSERELLILINEKVTRLEQEIAESRVMSEKISQLELRLARQEMQFKIWGTVLGFVAGIGGNLITQLFKQI